MIKLVTLEDYLVDKLHELAVDFRRDVERGVVIPDQPVADELSDMDIILNALQSVEDAPVPKSASLMTTCRNYPHCGPRDCPDHGSNRPENPR